MDEDVRDERSADEFMLITISLEFQGKLNSKYKVQRDEDELSLDHIQGSHYALPADEDAAVYLEKVVKAIREKRLYGFMIQESADSHCSAKEWIEKTYDEMVKEGSLPPGVIGFSARKK